MLLEEKREAAPTVLMRLAARAHSRYPITDDNIDKILGLMVQETKKNPAIIHAQDPQGRTALHYAAQPLTGLPEYAIKKLSYHDERVWIIALLVYLGCDPFVRDDQGMTAADTLHTYCEDVDPQHLAIRCLSDPCSAKETVKLYKAKREKELKTAKELHDPREEERRKNEAMMAFLREEVLPKIKQRYHAAAPFIIPPTDFDPIFEDPKQTLESKENLRLSLSYILATDAAAHRWDTHIQLFSIPNTHHDCAAFAWVGYAPTLENHPRCPAWRPSAREGWIKLENPKDFSDRSGFEKLFVYEGHVSRLWKGAVLSKHGSPNLNGGATAVYCANSPEHPFIVEGYGEVEEVWVRKSNTPIPAPFFREQSVWIGAPVGKDGGRHASQAALREQVEALQLSAEQHRQRQHNAPVAEQQRGNLVHISQAGSIAFFDPKGNACAQQISSDHAYSL